MRMRLFVLLRKLRRDYYDADESRLNHVTESELKSTWSYRLPLLAALEDLGENRCICVCNKALVCCSPAIHDRSMSDLSSYPIQDTRYNFKF